MASVDNNFSDFVGYLKSSFDQSVVWHHQTDSYPVHKALNKFYKGILDLIDGLVESVSGVHGRPKDYEIDEPVNYDDNYGNFAGTDGSDYFTSEGDNRPDFNDAVPIPVVSSRSNVTLSDINDTPTSTSSPLIRSRENVI